MAAPLVALLVVPAMMLQACVFELAELAPGAGGGGGGAAAGGAGPGGGPADWWDEAFAHRMRLGLSGEDEPIDAAVIPVFLDAGFPYDQVEPGGADLRFVDADGTTPLPYEIERWATGGDSLLWVRVPQLEPTDHVWLYWGNPGQPPGDTPAAVWEGYESVVHMSDAPTGGDTPIDNPGDGDDHLASGLGAANVVEGVLGPAYRFDGGAGQSIQASTTSAYAIPAGGQASLEGWFQWDGIDEGAFLAHEGCCLGFYLDIRNGGDIYTRWGVGDCCNGGTDYDEGLVSLPAGTAADWHHYVSVFDRAGGTAQLYIDGTPLGDPLAIDPGPDFAPQSHYRIGSDFGGNYNFSGVLDETRFATFAYTPSRIALHARAGLDQVIDYGAPQSLP